MAALHAIRVLDVGTRVSTAWCARLFAGYGAEVVSVEPADGHPLRRHPPFDASGNSIPARYVLAGQRKGDPEQLDGLVEQADVIVTSALPGEPLEPQALVARNPKALVCAITPHGLTGSRAGLPGNELTANARSGWASVNGLQGREPLKGSGYQASYQAGTFAFGVAISALIEQLANDSAGQVIDIGESDVLVSTFSPAPLRYQYSGFVWAQNPVSMSTKGRYRWRTVGLP
ncbi:MAG: CoA transferase [Pseudomonadales bacterium]